MLHTKDDDFIPVDLNENSVIAHSQAILRMKQVRRLSSPARLVRSASIFSTIR